MGMLSRTSLLLLGLLAIAVQASAQISERDVQDLIRTYRNRDVGALQQGMPPPQTEKRFRQYIYQSLPPEVLRQRINNPELTEKLRQVLEPVLSFYGRAGVYDLVIIRSPTPLMMSDSGVVLVITTGMIQQARSDDELLGYAAHEVGHEYFVYYSVESKRLLRTVASKGNEQVLRRKLSEVLGLIELQCDAFAALTLAALKYEPLEFIRGFERIESNFPEHLSSAHPGDAIRRKVVEGVTSYRVQARQSKALKELKEALDNPPSRE